jgi:hypothetical protein
MLKIYAKIQHPIQINASLNTYQDDRFQTHHWESCILESMLVMDAT